MFSKNSFQPNDYSSLLVTFILLVLFIIHIIHYYLTTFLELCQYYLLQYLLKIPFVIIRSISDKILLKEGEQSSVINLDLASKNCVDVLFDLI